MGGAIDADYTTLFDLDELYMALIDDENPNSLIAEALNLAITFLSNLIGRYKRGVRGIWDDMDKLTLLAHHIAPDTKAFDAWLNTRFERALTLFQADYITCPINHEHDIYNVAIDAPIARNFFFSDSVDINERDENDSIAIKKFLNGLDWVENKLLHTPQEMTENGFAGTPYCYEN